VPEPERTPTGQPTVTVAAAAAASAVPDMALLQLGVETRGSTPGETTIWAAVTVTWSLNPG
jgi:uncharacterized protein YggE